MNKKTHNIKDFIGIYDNYITPEECKKAIKLFEDQDKFQKTVTRQQKENIAGELKKDKHFFAGEKNLEVWQNNLETIVHNFDMAFKHYAKETGGAYAYNNMNFYYTCFKIQKTLPKEGYHVWHIEHGHGMDYESRAFAYSIFLNDVEEGGETEFLNQAVRVKPKTGRIAIWPAGFPYLHRGNPPLSGEKYILTSWMMLRIV